MFKKIASAVLGSALLLSPVAASAQSNGDIQALIQTLLAQVAALQQQLVALQAQTSGSTILAPTATTQSSTPSLYAQAAYTTGGSTSSDQARCVTLSRNFGLDDTDAETNGEVSKLQRFLMSEYREFTAEYVTGYFGPMTEAALKQWQKDQGIASSGNANTTGWGYIGPRTRAILAQKCATLPPQQSVTPVTILPARPVPAIKLSANPTAIKQGESTVISWTAQNATRCWMQSSEGWEIGSIKTLGNQEVSPKESATYTVGCANEDGSGKDGPQATVSVRISITANAAGSISVSSPAGGSYTTGQTLASVWSDPMKTSVTSYYLTLWPYPTKDAGWTMAGDGTKAGSVYSLNHSWVIPSYVQAGTYVVSVCRLGEPVCGDSAPITISKTVDANTIKITAPNGGEQWEIGQLNTITWSPYSYSPVTINGASDVTVYLEKKCTTRSEMAMYIQCEKDGFYSVGKVMDQGKASLHTYFNIDSYDKWATAGQYYVRAVNNRTGQWDRSDAAFTLLARSVDLKVNGSDSGVTVSDNQAITLSWTLANYDFNRDGACTLSGVRRTPGGSFTSFALPASGSGGSGTYYAYAPYPGSYSSVGLSCTDGAKGLTHTDYVSVLSSGAQQAASLSVVSPNGGEQFTLDQPYEIKWNEKGIKSLSIALYQNDQWNQWIVKDNPSDAENVHAGGIGSYQWAPKSGSIAPGSNYKIYITGQKADGTGYVDDKSDSTFSFTGGTTSTGPAVPNVWTKSTFSLGGSGSSVCTGAKYVGFSQKYNAWVGAQLCGSSDKYKLYMSNFQAGPYYQIADFGGHGQDHCELVNPTFTIPNDDDITSGTCKNCALGELVDVQNENVFARSRSGETFKLAPSTYWADLTTSYYMCGVSIGSAMESTIPAPSCTITSDKSSYTYGESIVFSWTSQNASYVSVIPDTSGKDNLDVSAYAGKQPTSGSITVKASVSGNPYVTMQAVSSTGSSASCTRTVSVSFPPSTATSTNASYPSFWTKAGHEQAICLHFTGTSAYVDQESKVITCTEGRCVSPKFYWMLGDWAVPEDRASYLPADKTIKRIQCQGVCTEANACQEKVASAASQSDAKNLANAYTALVQALEFLKSLER